MMSPFSLLGMREILVSSPAQPKIWQWFDGSPVDFSMEPMFFQYNRPNLVSIAAVTGQWNGWPFCMLTDVVCQKGSCNCTEVTLLTSKTPKTTIMTTRHTTTTKLPKLKTPKSTKIPKPKTPKPTTPKANTRITVPPTHKRRECCGKSTKTTRKPNPKATTNRPPTKLPFMPTHKKSECCKSQSKVTARGRNPVQKN
ncbi:hypothetical protein DdX_17504 [Ditylenchus destructor]|uniref:Uncharacterized protein n=1 Tax=Ditylenchus destructor TaxID=166010 RepID=A0AAD4MNB7_9BILA|nr:hypothetical protein DdX_17504 [Ditylenchus destructor]